MTLHGWGAIEIPAQCEVQFSSPTKKFRGLTKTGDECRVLQLSKGQEDIQWNQLVKEKVTCNGIMPSKTIEEVTEIITGETMSNEEAGQLIQEATLNENNIE